MKRVLGEVKNQKTGRILKAGMKKEGFCCQVPSEPRPGGLMRPGLELSALALPYAATATGA